VTRKITSAAARIAAGSDEVLELGNLNAVRDWGWAPEYVEAMWRMLQGSTPNDYVLSTGTLTSVRAFAEAAFKAKRIPLLFEADAAGQEVARDRDSGRVRLRTNPKFHRSVEPVGLTGNSLKAERELGWKARVAGAAVAEAMILAEGRVEGSLS
jgi:GDPmannose 4,6-dehydratase